jgi:peptide/nickel transport system substrate-binding protein
MAMKKSLRSRKLLGIVLAAGLIIGVAGCSDNSSSNKADGLILNVGGQVDNLTQAFNPFLPNNALSLGSGGMIYEKLVQINYVNVGHDIPWLAKSWDWTNENKTLTLHLQQGVKFSDGKPFSSKDVVFSFNLMKKFPALNTSGVEFETAKAVDTNTVELTFATPSEVNYPTILSQTIVPEHIWSKIKDPTKYADKDPVGSGPFTLSSFSPQSYLLVKNKDYWQPGKPKIGGIRFISYKDNPAQAQALVQGKIDWAGAYIANAKETYLSKNKNFHYWAPDVGMDGLIPNLDTWPLSELSVRKAISLGVDRDQIAASRNSHPATSQIGLPMPAFKDAIAPQYKGLDYKQDVKGAIKLLTDDGFTKDSDGYFAKDGKEIAFKITVPSAYTDTVAPAQVLVSQLKDIGMKVTIDGVSVDSINDLTGTGKFQATIGYPVDSAPTVYSFYNNIMNPKYYKPIGEATPTYQNIERFQDPEAEQLLDLYPLATTDAQRNEITAKLQGIWINKLPMITLFYWGNYGDYSTEKVTGFPSPSDPYFAPTVNVVVATRLVPKK